MDFILEIIARFLARTPKFFRVLRLVAVVVAVVTGLPEILEANGVELGPALQKIANEVVAYAAVIGGIIAQLTATIEDKKNNPEISD